MGLATTKKTNIRSIRFSDELAELIDQQVGQTFTEKFENLITRCVWELPQKEKELEQINREITTKRQQLREMSQQAWKISNTIQTLERTINQEIKKWEV